MSCWKVSVRMLAEAWDSGPVVLWATKSPALYSAAGFVAHRLACYLRVEALIGTNKPYIFSLDC